MPFADGRPIGKPEDVLTGFVDADGDAVGRPVGVVVDRTGALLVADDVGNTIRLYDHPIRVGIHTPDATILVQVEQRELVIFSARYLLRRPPA